MRAEEDVMPETTAETLAPQYRIFAPFTDDELEALDVAHKDIRRVTGATPPAKSWRRTEKPEPPWEVVFRKPTGSGEFAFFEKHAHNDSAKDRALRLYAKALIVGVSVGGRKVLNLNSKDNKQNVDIRRAWDLLCEEYPGVHMAAKDEIMDLSGMGKEEAGKD